MEIMNHNAYKLNGKNARHGYKWWLYLWYHSLTPPINFLSRLALMGKEHWLLNTYLDVSDILHHEGKHSLSNTRYKEWWYFDLHAESGIVVSCAIVFSIAKDHYFLRVYDPTEDKILQEIEHDGDVSANSFGSEGLKLSGEFISIEGRFDEGYHLEFDGVTLRGEFDFSDLVTGRCGVHIGEKKTYYGLYQVPGMEVHGTLTNKSSEAKTVISGQGYHDHWWGVVNRYTRWKWMQVKFDNRWIASFYEGCYGFMAQDLDWYAWLYRPDFGYTYFDNETFDFREDKDNEQWTASISGQAGALTVTGIKHEESYQFKPVVFYGIPIGKVDYYQYPITAKGTFIDADGNKTDLTSTFGMLEWDWHAIW
jgi:hypothetical protein